MRAMAAVSQPEMLKKARSGKLTGLFLERV